MARGETVQVKVVNPPLVLPPTQVVRT